TAMAALIACTRSSLPSPPFPGAYQNEKVRPIAAVSPGEFSLNCAPSTARLASVLSEKAK
ncbi:MAG: hypothetical protein ACLQVX_24050, partial [Limisphaerales bacterium]